MAETRHVIGHGGGADGLTLRALLRQRAGVYGDKPFLLTRSGAIGYRTMDRRTDRLAAGLHRLGLRPGETVLVMLPNCREFVELWFALAKLGVIQVPVNTAYRGAILGHVIADSLASTMIADPAFLDRVEAVGGEAAGLRRLILSWPGAVPEGLAAGREVLALDALYAEEAALPSGPRDGDLLAVMYTSGTTGPSKGVMITHAHAYHYALSCVEMLALDPGDVYYAPLPLFHIAGQWAVVFAALIAGAAAAVGPFSVSSFWDEVARRRATATFLLGAMASLLHRQPPLAEDALTPLAKALVVPLFPEVEAFKRRFGVAVTTTYGSTEVNVPVRAGFDLPDYRTCGRVKDDLYEVRIVDENDEEVPLGQVGELVVRGKRPFILMAGYWNHPEWTVKAWRNLWLHSGDAMRMDEAGNLYFVDRLKDAIRRRGENISSMEVEREIDGHPAVLESAVVPVRSPDTEDEVLAVVTVRPGMRLDPADLIRHLAPRLPYFMVPRYVEVALALPRTPTGKVQKFALRERGLGPGAWDRVRAGIRLDK